MDAIDTATMMSVATAGSTPSIVPTPARMNENSPICASADGTVSTMRSGYRITASISATTIGLPTTTTASAAAKSHGCVEERGRVEQHADRDEKQHGKRVAHRQRVARGAQAVVGPVDDHSRDERPKRHRDAEQPGRPDGDAERDHQDGERKQLARPASQPRDRAATESGAGRRSPQTPRGRRPSRPRSRRRSRPTRR